MEMLMENLIVKPSQLIVSLYTMVIIVLIYVLICVQKIRITLEIRVRSYALTVVRLYTILLLT